MKTWPLLLLLLLPTLASAVTLTLPEKLARPANCTILAYDAKGKCFRTQVEEMPLPDGCTAIPYPNNLPPGTYHLRAVLHDKLCLDPAPSAPAEKLLPPGPVSDVLYLADCKTATAQMWVAVGDAVVRIAPDGVPLPDIAVHNPIALARDAGEKALPQYSGYVLCPGTLYGVKVDGTPEPLYTWRMERNRLWPLLALTVRDGIAVISNGNESDTTGDLRVVNLRTHKVLWGQRTAPSRGVALSNDGRLFGIVGKQVHVWHIDYATGALSDEKTVIADGLADPQRVIIGPCWKKLLITDWGLQPQVKIFDFDGKLLRTVGNPGGEQLGVYDPLRMDHPEGLAVTGSGVLWVAECSGVSRVSEWKLSDGSLAGSLNCMPYREVAAVGPDGATIYRAIPYPPDPCGLRLHRDANGHLVTTVYYRGFYPTGGADLLTPATARRLLDTLQLPMPCEPSLQIGSAPVQSVTMATHTYVWRELGDEAVLWLLDGDVAKPVAAIGPRWELNSHTLHPILASALDGVNIAKLFTGDADATWVWSDTDGNGFISADEVRVLPLHAALGWVVRADLSLYNPHRGLLLRTSNVDGRGIPHFSDAPVHAAAELPQFIWHCWFSDGTCVVKTGEGISLHLNPGVGLNQSLVTMTHDGTPRMVVGPELNTVARLVGYDTMRTVDLGTITIPAKPTAK